MASFTFMSMSTAESDLSASCIDRRAAASIAYRISAALAATVSALASASATATALTLKADPFLGGQVKSLTNIADVGSRYPNSGQNSRGSSQIKPGRDSTRRSQAVRFG